MPYGKEIVVGGVSRGLRTVCTETLTLAVGEHAAGDVLGGKIEFDGAARFDGGGGEIFGPTIVNDSGGDVEMELWLFNSEPTAIADDAAFAPTEADLHNLAGIFSTTDGSWRAAGTPSACHIDDKLISFDLASGTSLWGFLVCRAAFTPAAADDVTVILPITRD